EGELEAEIFETYFKIALKKLGENVKIDGFRAGKVPENVLLANIPEIKILEEMAQMALNEHYPKILETEMLALIGRPEIAITKLARNNPLGFKIKSALLPEVKLPDYKKIAKKVIGGVTHEEKNVSVSEEEIENTIMDIRKSRAPKKHIADVPAEASAKEGGATKEEAEKAEELPEWNDEFVKGLGPFENIADFREKLKVNIKLEKENQLKEKTRLKIMEEILNASTIDTPNILVEAELDKILYRMESDITQMGLKFEDYLKHLNKTVEDLRKEFRTDALKKANLGLVINEIAKAEKIQADEAEVAKEVAHILEHYKDADPERAAIHAENVLTNEKVFQFLENQ
ncbi:MAG: trigger factor, partial [Minisyncoccia bacterium]